MIKILIVEAIVTLDRHDDKEAKYIEEAKLLVEEQLGYVSTEVSSLSTKTVGNQIEVHLLLRSR